MYSVMLKDGFSNARANARLRIESTLDLNRLFRAIDADPAIVGAGVVYIDNQFNVVTLRDFQPICSVTVKRVILREAPRHMAPQQFAQELETNPRESKIVFEAIGMALSCAGAFIAWNMLGAAGSVMTPFSAGASTVVAYIGYAAAGATAAQCYVAIHRTIFELGKPEWNDALDSNEWYQNASMVLDTVSLIGAATTATTTIRSVSAIKAATGKGVRDVLKGLTRQDRVKLTNELLRLQDPRLSPQLLRLKKVSGELPKRFTPAQFRHGTLLQIKDSFGAGLAVVGSGVSGSLSAVAVGLYSEVTDG